MVNDYLRSLQKYFPTSSIPLILVESGTSECGFENYSRYFGIFRYTINEYLSLKPIDDKTQSFQLKESYQPEPNSLWIIELKHYLRQILNGRFEQSFLLWNFFNSNYKICFPIYSKEQQTNIYELYMDFIEKANTTHVYETCYELTSKIVTTRLNDPKKRKSFPRQALILFRYCLYAEAILQQKGFIEPNLFQLKNNHPLEALIDRLMDLNTQNEIISSSLMQEVINQWGKFMTRLKLLDKAKIPISYTEIEQKGTALFLALIKDD